MAAVRRLGSLRGALLLALALGVVLLLLGAGAARAHAELESSDPPNGAVLDQLPSHVRLAFEEAVVLRDASIELLSGSTSVPLVDLATSEGGRVVTATVPPGTSASGPVTFRWSVVSADGHPVSGDIDTAVGPGAVPTPAASSPKPPGNRDLVDGLVTADRMVGYLGLTILIGGFVFLVVLWPEGADLRRSRMLLWTSWGAACLATISGLLLQAATLRGAQLSEAFDGDAWDSVLDSPFGRAWGSRAILLLLAVPLLVAAGREGSRVVREGWFVVPGAVLGLALLRTLGLVSHASEGELGGVGAVADLVHLCGVTAWMGGLVFMAVVVLPRRRTAELRRIVPAFSRMALGSVVVIVVAGAVMAWDLAGSLHALSSTEWGRLLVAKVVVFVVVVVAAQLSKRWVDDRLGMAVALRGHLVLVRPFVLSVAAETLLAASVLGVASALVTTSPGR